MNLNPKIYKINKNHRLLNNISETDKICKFIITYSRREVNNKFVLNEDNYTYEIDEDNNFKYFLYTFNSSEVESEWKNYFPTTLSAKSNFIQQNLSLIFFIEFEDFLYLIIGGNSYRIILPFIDEGFGIDLYSRILDPENDELISIKTRSLTGKKAGSYIYYKDNFKLIDHIKFGTIPKEINVKLSNVENSNFNFLKSTANEKIQISISNSIKFKRIVDFENLKKLIKEIKYFEEIDKNDYLTTYLKIDNQDLINSLNDKIINNIHNDIPNIDQRKENIHTKFYFEFCHPKFIDKFYEADTFHLFEKTEETKYSYFGKTNDKNKIYEIVIRRALEIYSINISFNNLKYFLLGVKVRSYKKGIRKLNTVAPFIMHLNTEVDLNNQPYFYLDNNWYLLQESFIKDINNQCKRILKNYIAPVNILNKNWDKKVLKKESEYNLLYLDEPNYLVFDTITIDGIELCDILFYDNTSVYLIHVKNGFDSSMRELYNQIILSARRLQESLSTNEKKYLKSNFQSMIKKDKLDQNLSEDDFLNLFTKKISYVMAFTSKHITELNIIDEVEQIKSSIAKFSVIQASSEMRAEYYDLFFCQINR
ncbi:DUF6119 family protein [Empedobacter sp. UBA7248]|uniref:DUF6119 family protein n=1 Tax=Empedobacter sp. UBA7248 TaxID=1946448 RepID=UPI0025BF51EA|nr:DUF6119 family protein [Empedobacter sp. UBA7248]